jgi:GNAT superfamily N-acetyltransferase
MISVVSTADRPDLVAVTGHWRWEAFFKNEKDLVEMLRLEKECASNGELMPTVLVLLEGNQPAGMIALCLDDLEGRPDLNPWLAGVYVEPSYRGRGYALRLVSELEAFARNAGIKRLSLYTRTAEGLYKKAGWAVTEVVERKGRPYSVMQKAL